MTWWCEIFYFKNPSTGDRKRVLVCSPEEMKYLIQDAVELAYKNRGYGVEKTEVLGRFDDVATAEHGDDNE